MDNTSNSKAYMVSSLKAPLNLRCEYISNPIGVDAYEPRFSWYLSSEERGQTQIAYQILVASTLEALNKNVGDKWDSGKVYSNECIQVAYKGAELFSGERCYWKVRSWDQNDRFSPYSEWAFFEMGLLEENDWKGKWIGAKKSISSPLFRKVFTMDKEIKKARVYICGLGYYELYLNGNKIGDHVLDPNWTNYDSRNMEDLLYPFDDQSSKSVLYITYDVTEALRKGENAIGVMLGNGWYNQRERIVEGKLWYGCPKLILQVSIEYGDGSTQMVISDDSWKFSEGPITFNNIFFGEEYDARLEADGWDRAGFSDSIWEPAILAAPPEGVLKAQMSPPDKVTGLINPVKMTNPNPGVYVFDMGQNISGWAAIKVKGTRGTKVTLRFAEEIGDDGNLDFESAGGEAQIQKDTYILKGEGQESYEPRFTWHGFRYVEVTGYPGTPTMDDIVGKVVHSAVGNRGVFNCSNSLLNKIQNNYRWSQLSNLHGGVPSDCPHRERLGYTGDGQITAEAAIYNFDMAQFYTKWVQDIRDAQNIESGFVPHTVPFYGGGGGPGWGSAFIIIPWYMYLYYGDRRILEEHYPSMQHWMEYLSTRTDEKGIIIREEPGSWCLGDWCTPDKIKLPESLVNTFYYILISRMMADIADILGKEDEAIAYASLGENISRAFNDEFFAPELNQYSINCQGADVFPLALGIVPEGSRDEVLKNLTNHISTHHQGHLDTGIFGTPLLLDILIQYGYENIAYGILNKTTFPSYGYMFENGATTLWECWDGRGSHNHPMFGSVSAWFYKVLAGIRADIKSPGFENIIIQPNLIGDLSWVKASYESVRGIIAVGWEKKEHKLTLEVQIPVGSRAKIFIPKLDLCDITITDNGIEIWKDHNLAHGAPGIYEGVESDDSILLRVGSGHYNFTVYKCNK